MSRHNRQRNKRRARYLLTVFNKMNQVKPADLPRGLSTCLVELIRYRLETTGKFPRYINPEQREAYKRFG